MRHLLFNPGPTNVHPDVRAALLAKDLCHREAEFTDVMRRVGDRMVRLLNGAGSHHCIPFVASGTGANEAMIAAVDGKMLVLVAGRYSERLADIAARLKVPHERLIFPPLPGVDLNTVEWALRRDSSITHLCLAHHETTRGVLAPLREIGRLARQFGVRVMVDGVSSIFGHEFDLQEDNIAFCTVTANKCLESVPGISFVIGRVEEFERTEGKSRSYYFDLHQQWDRCQRSGKPPFTVATQQFFAADAALDRLEAEGCDGRARRYRRLRDRLGEGVGRLGFELVPIPEEQRANILTLLRLPPGVSYRALHDRMLEAGVTIYTDQGTLGQGMIFFATMGALDESDVDYFLQHLDHALAAQGYSAAAAAAPAAAAVEAAQ
jgi:2-aminoethylphosphonate-pyruvate transaminase